MIRLLHASLLMLWLVLPCRSDEKAPPTDAPKASTSLLDDAAEFSFKSEDITLTDANTPEPWLGIWLQDIDSLESLLDASGVRVHAVAPEGPADKAGLLKGDIITHWNQVPVTEAETLHLKMNLLKIAEEVTLTVYRDKVSKTIKVKVIDGKTYPRHDEWQPYLPTFESAEELDKVFDDNANELEALKASFEALAKETPKAKNE